MYTCCALPSLSLLEIIEITNKTSCGGKDKFAIFSVFVKVGLLVSWKSKSGWKFVYTIFRLKFYELILYSNEIWKFSVRNQPWLNLKFFIFQVEQKKKEKMIKMDEKCVMWCWCCRMVFITLLDIESNLFSSGTKSSFRSRLFRTNKE